MKKIDKSIKKIDNNKNEEKNKVEINPIIKEEKEKGRYIEKYSIDDSSTLNDFINRGSNITDNEYEVKSEIN